MIDGDHSDVGSKQMIRTCERQGEPLVFGLPGGEGMASYVAARGLATVVDLGPEDLAERYLPSPEHRVFGAVRIAHVRQA